MALLHLLKSGAQKSGYFLSAVHLNHKLRGTQSDADAALVKNACEQMGVPLFAFESDVAALAKRSGESLETAARNERRRIFQQLVNSGKADYIATAHHKNDQAETLLFRLCRGTALGGMRGIREEGIFLRPLLSWTKADVLNYVKENGVEYRDDQSNFVADVTRNKIRLLCLTELEKAVPGATENIAAFADVAAQDEELLTRLSKTLIKRERQSGADTGWRVSFCKDKPLFYRAVLVVLNELDAAKDCERSFLERVYTLQALQTGKKVELRHGVFVVKAYEEIVFYKEGETRPLKGVISTLPMPCDGKTLRADGDKIPKTAVIRTPQEGDVFTKFGGGTKTLKKYLVDQKIDAQKRKVLPVLADGNRILAVFGVEISADIKCTEQTERTVYLLLRKKDGKDDDDA